MVSLARIASTVVMMLCATFSSAAEVEIVYGSGGWPFASVVDQRTGDPTTVLPRHIPECSRTIDDLLAEIDGMEVEELDTQHEGYRFFELRYVTFLEQVGDAQCRDDLLTYQRELLSRRGAMLPRAETYYGQFGLTFDRIGGLETAFESAVIELGFSFWQFSGPNQCPQIPDGTATDDELFDYFNDDWAMFLASDDDMGLLGPYFFQAASQLGYPALSATNLEDLLVTDWVSLEKGLTPVGSNPVFDPTSMPDIHQWVLANGENMLFVYGEVDPWSAGAFEVDETVGSYRFWVEDGTHSAMINALSSDDLALVRGLLEDWTGIRPKHTWIAIPDPEQVNVPLVRHDELIGFERVGTKELCCD